MRTPLPIISGSAAFAGIGLLIFYLALLDSIDTWRFLDTTLTVPGRVDAISSRTTTVGPSNNQRQGTSDLAFIRFKTRDGAIIGFEHQYGLIENSLSPGDTVDVAYPEEAPHQARVANFAALWAGNIAMLVLGSLFMAAGFTLYRVFGKVR